MKRNETIKDKKEFNNIIKNGHYVKNKFFVIYYIENKSDKPMYGLAIKRKIGNAVTRNRLKRQTREIIHFSKKEFKNKYNYIIMIREGCLEGKYQILNESFNTLLERIK